jgi:hypothetical protein
MEKQLIGTQQDLKKGPGTMNHEGKTGTPTKELVGTQAPVSYTPASNEHNGNIREGTRSLVGTSVPLSTATHKSFESMDTPMSERVKVQK